MSKSNLKKKKKKKQDYKEKKFFIKTGQLGNNGQVFVTPEECVYGKVLCFKAVFEENVKVLSKPWRRWRRCAKTLTFSYISVITEDIYLKLRLVVHYQKGNPYQ